MKYIVLTFAMSCKSFILIYSAESDHSVLACTGDNPQTSWIISSFRQTTRGTTNTERPYMRKISAESAAINIWRLISAESVTNEIEHGLCACTER